jgi:predicted MFS family arabinose efflux permease
MFGTVFAAGLALGIVVAALMDSWRWAVVLATVLALLIAAVILTELRRLDARRVADRKRLKRLERKVDHLALRVIAESQATHQELGGLIEELGARLKRPE